MGEVGLLLRDVLLAVAERLRQDAHKVGGLLLQHLLIQRAQVDEVAWETAAAEHSQQPQSPPRPQPLSPATSGRSLAVTEDHKYGCEKGCLWPDAAWCIDGGRKLF